MKLFGSMVTAAVMVAAAAVAAATALVVMVLTMMIALDIGVVQQIASDQGFHCAVGIAGNTAKKLDACSSQCHLGTAANTAADQGIHLQCTQDACQCTMSAAASIHNLRRNDFPSSTS